MPKRLTASHTVLARSKQCLHNKNRKTNREHWCGASQIPSESQVRTFATTLECQSWGELCVLVFLGSLGFYSSVESSFEICVISLFLIKKISINVCIFWNPPCVRIPFILGLYGLGFIMRCKLFSFRVSWRSHNDQLSATWPFDPSTLCSFTKDPFIFDHFCLPCQVHLNGSITSNFLPLHLY